MGKRTLVTGAAGFIGSHLVEHLLSAGHHVLGIDNLCCGRKSNLENAERSDRFSFVQKDITDLAGITPCFDGIDWVFHLAALADIVPSIEHPQRYHDTNVNGTLAVLEAARESGVRRFIYTGSSSCYGLPDQTPTPETAPSSPMYPYALSKMLGEQLILHWCKVYQLPALSLRLFNVYGPRSRTSGTYGAVFGVFLAQKLAGKPYTVVGDGSQTRDFTYVTDVARAFVAAANSEVVGEVYNIGSGGTYSINHLVSLLEGEVTYIPKRPGEPIATFADISKISRQIGWTPSVDFDDGVKRMLDHIEQWQSAPVWTPSSINKATEKWFSHIA